MIRGSKSSRNIAQFGEKILYKPLRLSGDHRGNLDDGWHLSGSDQMNFSSEQQEELSRRAHCEDELMKNNGTNEFAMTIRGKPRQPVPGINSDHVLAAITVRAEEDQADARLGQQDEDIDPREAQEVLTAPDRPRLAVITKPVSRIHAGTGCAQNWRRVKKEENILPENKHVWMQGNKSNRQATNVLCKFWRMGEEDVTIATSGASASKCKRRPGHGHRQPAIPGNEPLMFGCK